MSYQHERSQIDLIRLRSKAKDVENSLVLLEQDLDLIINHKIPIYISIDFYDLINYVYPNRKVFSKKYKDSELKKAISREVLFNMLGSIYNYPIILLPPYLSEINDFFYLTKRKLSKLEDDKYKAKINNGIIEVLNRLDDLEYKDERDLLIGFEEEVYYLTLFYSKFFSTGILGLKNLLQSNFTPNPKEISDYNKIIYNTKAEKNMHFSIFRDIRPNKSIQNIRDSRAVQYIDSLNKELEGKGVIYFISSSQIMIKAKSKLNLVLMHDSVKYDTIRPTESIYYYILAMYFSLGFNTIEDYAEDGNLKLELEELKILHRSVKEQINLLKSIPSVTELMIQMEDQGLVGGDYTYWIDRINEFNNIIDKLEKDIWLTYTKIKSEKDDRQLNKFFNLDVTTRLDDLRRELDRIDFSEELDQDLKRARINFYQWILKEASDSGTKPIIGPEFLMWCVAIGDRWEFMKKFGDINYLNNILKRTDSDILEDPRILPLKDGLMILYDETKKNRDIYFIIPDEFVHEDKPIIRIYEIGLEEIYSYLINTLNSEDRNVDFYDPLIESMNIIIDKKINIRTYDDMMNKIVNIMEKLRSKSK